MRIRTKSFVIAICQGLQQATSILLAMILVRIVSQDVFGTYRQVNLVYMFLAGVISLQLHSSLYYFIPKLGNKMRKQLLLQTILGTFVTSAIVSIILFLCSLYISKLFNNPELSKLLKVYSFLPFFERQSKLIPAFMISLDRAVRGSIYSLIATVSRIVVVVMVFVNDGSLYTIVWSIVLTEAIVSIFGSIDMLRFCKFGKWTISYKLALEQFNYSWPLLATSVVGLLKIQLDKILISSYYDPETFAVYSCGAFELPVIGLITSSLTMAITPTLVDLFSKNQVVGAMEVWNQSARKSSLIIFPCFAFFVFFGYEVINLMYGDDYTKAALPFRIYLLSLPLRVVVYSALLRALGKTKSIAVSAFWALVVNAVISPMLLFIGRGSVLSYIGPAIGTVIAEWFICCMLLKSICNYTEIPLSRIMKWRELGVLFLTSCICAGLVYFIPMPVSNILVRLAIHGLFYCIIFLIFIFVFGLLQKDEKQMLFLPVKYVNAGLYNWLLHITITDKVD